MTKPYKTSEVVYHSQEPFSKTTMLDDMSPSIPIDDVEVSFNNQNYNKKYRTSGQFDPRKRFKVTRKGWSKLQCRCEVITRE